MKTLILTACLSFSVHTVASAAIVFQSSGLVGANSAMPGVTDGATLQYTMDVNFDTFIGGDGTPAVPNTIIFESGGNVKGVGAYLNDQGEIWFGFGQATAGGSSVTQMSFDIGSSATYQTGIDYELKFVHDFDNNIGFIAIDNVIVAQSTSSVLASTGIGGAAGYGFGLNDGSGSTGGGRFGGFDIDYGDFAEWDLGTNGSLANLVVDDVVVIPEPSTFALVSAFGLVIAGQRRRK